MQKLSSWPVIKYDDGPALKRFSFFLTKCNNAMKTIAHMAVVNHPPNMQSIVQKLPNNLQTKWRETVVKGRRKDGKIADFRDLTKFVEYAAESANDPIYSKDALSNAKSKAGPASSFTSYNQKLPTSRPNCTSFATNLEAPTQSPSSHGAGYSRQNAAASRCSLCHKSHDLEECEVC